MPFTLWYARSGCTGSISSARKKRLRAVSSLKSVLWCERGKCMQPRVHQLYMCVSVLLGLWKKAIEKDTQWKLVLYGFSELTCWFLQGLWCGSNRRLKQLISFLFQCLFVSLPIIVLRLFSHWGHLVWITSLIMPPSCTNPAALISQ